MPKPKYSRNVEMFKAVVNGEAYAAVGKKHGCTSTNVRHIVMRFKRRILHKLHIEDSCLISLYAMRQEKAKWLKRIENYIPYKEEKY